MHLVRPLLIVHLFARLVLVSRQASARVPAMQFGASDDEAHPMRHRGTTPPVSGELACCANNGLSRTDGF